MVGPQSRRGPYGVRAPLGAEGVRGEAPKFLPGSVPAQLAKPVRGSVLDRVPPAGRGGP